MAKQFDNPLQPLQENLINNSVTLSAQTLEALDRLTNLQLQLLKVTFDETGANLAKVVEAKDATAAGDAINAWFAPAGDKLQAWYGHLETITNETGTEFARVLEKQIAGNGISLQAVLEAATVESTAGSQGKFPWMQPALFDSPAQKSSAPRSIETSPASRRPRNSGVSQVKRPAKRKKASPINA